MSQFTEKHSCKTLSDAMHMTSTRQKNFNLGRKEKIDALGECSSYKKPYVLHVLTVSKR